jgi:environmental stress-induced protein Ves
METEIGTVKKSRYRTSQWSGGTTTELLIYPSDSSYSERSFKWRISSAEVEASESEFTRLPGITRHIMVTDGQMLLDHENRYKKQLHSFQQDSFLGDWKTVSHGKATDFNLMLAVGFTGTLVVYFLEEGEQIDIALDKGLAKQVTNVFYALNGSLKIAVDEKKFNIEEKDLFYLTRLTVEGNGMLTLENTSKYRLVVIRAEILENAEG